MPKIPYGCKLDTNNCPLIDEPQATVVRSIYQGYLAGNSLGKIVDHLFGCNIPSSSGKDRWTRAMIDKVLSNRKYVPHIFGLEQYIAVQFEKQDRSNIDPDSGRRMANRYTSPSM